MEILPLKLLINEEKGIFGSNLVNLGILVRSDLPVAQGLAFTAPDEIIKTINKFSEDYNVQNFDNILNLLKNKLIKLNLPSEFLEKLKKENNFCFNNNYLSDKKILWQKILEAWFNETVSQITGGIYPGSKHFRLSAQVIYFFDQKLPQAAAFFDPNTQEIIIKSEDKLNPEITLEIDKIVTEANKKLFIPHIYTFVINKNSPLIIKLSPFTHTLPEKDQPNLVINKKNIKEIPKTTLKVFFNSLSGYFMIENLSGIVIDAEKITDFDEAVLKLTEVTSNADQVIFRLSSEDKIKEEIKSFLFIRNKKGICNLNLALPVATSPHQLETFKTDLLSLEINQKESLKLWWQLNYPENLINLEKYLEVGINGVIINLDSLQKSVGSEVSDVKTVIKFLDPFIKTFPKNQLPILAEGKLVLHPDMLDYLILNGVWGIIFSNLYEIESVPEYLSWAEKRMIIKNLSPVKKD